MATTVDLTREEDAPAAPAPPAKKHRKAASPIRVWVLAKGDWPEQHEKLVSVEVLGVFRSLAAAEEAKAEYLEEGGWMEGYGYHQGEDAESNIEVHEQVLQ